MTQLINASAYRPLSAFSGIPYRDSSFAVCLFPVANAAVFAQKKLRFGVRAIRVSYRVKDRVSA